MTRSYDTWLGVAASVRFTLYHKTGQLVALVCYFQELFLVSIYTRKITKRFIIEHSHLQGVSSSLRSFSMENVTKTSFIYSARIRQISTEYILDSYHPLILSSRIETVYAKVGFVTDAHTLTALRLRILAAYLSFCMSSTFRFTLCIAVHNFSLVTP